MYYHPRMVPTFPVGNISGMSSPPTAPFADPADWERFDFPFGKFSHPVYKSGAGPGILLMHELPGMTPECIRLAEIVKEKGFRVYLPLFFGEPGEDLGLVRGGLEVARLCVRGEVNCLATNRTSPISEWLRALCRLIHSECCSKGVGVIGMCFSGNFVLPVMLEPCVLAPVACQSALPFAISPIRKAALGVSSGDLSDIVLRSRTVPLHGYRFSTDCICPAERFDALQKALGEGFLRVDIPTGRLNPGNIRKHAHSVFAEDFAPDDPGHPTYQELEKLLVYFRSVL
jgi:dienelactone hydrolase